MSAISQYPDMTLLASEDAGWLQQPAEAKMDSLLQRFPEIDAVYGMNDRMAAGAFRAAGRRGREKEMIFVGIDACRVRGMEWNWCSTAYWMPPLSIPPKGIKWCNWQWIFSKRNLLNGKRS